MHQNKLLFTCLFAMVCFTAFSQPLTLRSTAGIGTIGGLTGFAFSFDVGIPVGKAFELAPTFTMTTVPSTSNGFNYRIDENDRTLVSTLTPADGPTEEQVNDGSFTSASLLILFKPLNLIQQRNSQKHDLMIGTGIGFKAYTWTRTRYELDQNNYAVRSIQHQAGSGLAPYFVKLGYSYQFGQRLLLGLVAGIDGYGLDPAPGAGFLMGVRL